MSVTLSLDPDVEKGLAAEARARGITLSDYLQEIAAREAASLPAKAASTGEERAREFLEWAANFPDMPPLSDEAISRESMYPDRW